MGMRREVHGKQSSERELNPGVQGKPQKKKNRKTNRPGNNIGRDNKCTDKGQKD